MDGEDFQKGNQKRASGLGLRDAIEETLARNESLTRKKAEELFNEMEIIAHIKQAIDDGHDICRIPFSSELVDKYPTSKFLGNKKYADLFLALKALLVSEGVSGWAENDYGEIVNNQNGAYQTLVISNFLPN